MDLLVTKRKSLQGVWWEGARRVSGQRHPSTLRAPGAILTLQNWL